MTAQFKQGRKDTMNDATLSIQKYTGTLTGGGSLQFLERLGTESGSPYMAILDDVFIIGPLMVHHRPNGQLHAVNTRHDTISSDFGTSAAGQARDQFAAECGPAKPGSYLWLWNLRAYNIWHWIMEGLPKVIMAQENGFDGWYVIPEVTDNSRYIYESLELMGVAPGRIKYYDGRPWRVERLYLPQSISGNRQLARYPEIISRIRHQLVTACSPLSYSCDRIYIARQNPGLSRRVTNELHLLEILFNYGFQRVVMENYSLKEQIAVAAGADCLVAPHGAGMVHTLFMKPQSLVMELFPTTYINPCMLPVIDFLQHRYFMIPSHHTCVDENDSYEAYLSPIEVTLHREIEKQNVRGSLTSIADGTLDHALTFNAPMSHASP
jgi:capsular polysaccharide biosynthesis protein